MDEKLRLNRSFKGEVSKTETVRTEHSESAGKKIQEWILRGMRMCSHSWIFASGVHETKLI